MNYTDFITEMKQQVQKQAPNRVKIEKEKKYKNNGVLYEGLSFTEENNPNTLIVYMETYYEWWKSGKSMEEISQSILSQYEKNYMECDWDKDSFKSFTKAKEGIRFKLINREKNKELLKEIPYIPCLDLAVVFYYIIQTKYLQTKILDNATILIHNNHLDSWEIPLPKLYQCAKENTEKYEKAIFQPMGEILKEYIEEEMQENLSLYVLTTKRTIFGAAAFFYEGMQNQIYERINGPYYIIPSSVHEVIIVPQQLFPDTEAILDSIKDINMTQVEPDEILSDSLYCFNGENIEIITKI